MAIFWGVGGADRETSSAIFFSDIDFRWLFQTIQQQHGLTGSGASQSAINKILFKINYYSMHTSKSNGIGTMEICKIVLLFSTFDITTQIVLDILTSMKFRKSKCVL